MRWKQPPPGAIQNVLRMLNWIASGQAQGIARSTTRRFALPRLLMFLLGLVLMGRYRTLTGFLPFRLLVWLFLAQRVMRALRQRAMR